MAVVQKEVYSYPTAYTTSGSINGTRYKNAIGKGADTSAVSGNDYSNGGSSSTATIDYSFEFDIPDEADIISVACQVKGHAENTSRSTANLRLYAGSTAKGSISKFTSTSAQTVTLTTGTWTRSEVDQMKLRFTIGYYGGLVNGATVTVTYSYNDIKYTITVSNSTSVNVTANPTEVSPNHSSNIRADSISGLSIKDNGTDITNQFVQKTDTGSYEVETVGSYGFSINSNGYYQNDNKGVDKSASVCRVNFNLPTTATITFTFINYSEEGYDFGVFGNIDTALNTNYYPAGSSGATISDTSYKLACNTSTHNKSSTQTLTYSMSAGEHYIDVKYSKDDASAANNDTLQFKVAITLNGTAPTYYGYTITNIVADHTIVVTTSGGEVNTAYLKANGTWKELQIWRKVNGTWQTITDPTTVIDVANKYIMK